MITKHQRKPKRAALRGRKLKTVVAEKEGVLSPQQSVASASNRMRKLHTTNLPVAEDRKLVGAVEEPDPDVKLTAKGHDPAGWRVGEIMKREFVFCYEEEDCTHAQHVMDEHGLDCLPVVDREMRIIGIFERRDIDDE